jgi:hypothetical protein
MAHPASKRLMAAAGLMASLAMLALVTLSSIQQGRRSAKLQMVLVRPEQMQMMAGARRPEFVSQSPIHCSSFWGLGRATASDFAGAAAVQLRAGLS